MASRRKNIVGQLTGVERAVPSAESGQTVALKSVRLSPVVRATPRTLMVQHRFGVPDVAGQTLTLGSGASVVLGSGRVILLVGHSGSGKSSALETIAAQASISTIDVHDAEFSSDRGIIDDVAPDAEFGDAAGLLTACGLGEAGLWLRPYAALSEGEKFRARLARSISLAGRCESGTSPPAHPVPVLLCDEFCAGLHRRVARAVAHNLRKLVTRRGLCLVAACCGDELIDDLDPEVVVRFHHDGSCTEQARRPHVPPAPAFARTLHIAPGVKRDYDEFAGMHYRRSEELGFVDRVYVLRERAGGDALGIVVYAHAALELSLRNQATEGWFSRNPQQVNDHLRILRRLVIHPDVRGCGLGHLLVRRTMPLLGTEYVECLAAMGEFNPVFERAGMQRIGQYDAPAGAQNALTALRQMDAHPQQADFATAIARRPAVRSVVARAVADWYAATTGGGSRRVARQSPETLARAFRSLISVRPVYYLWRNPTHGETEKNSTCQNEPIENLEKPDL